MVTATGKTSHAILRPHPAIHVHRLPRPKSHVGTCLTPSGRTQSCQTAVANEDSAPTRPAAAGTPSTVRAAFAGALAGAARSLAAAACTSPRPRRVQHELPHPRGFPGDGFSRGGSPALEPRATD